MEASLIELLSQIRIRTQFKVALYMKTDLKNQVYNNTATLNPLSVIAVSDYSFLNLPSIPRLKKKIIMTPWDQKPKNKTYKIVAPQLLKSQLLCNLLVASNLFLEIIDKVYRLRSSWKNGMKFINLTVLQRGLAQRTT